ncbi:MAG: amidohydrolase family protein [Deltaproteobacteria bacterium]|nr:amidohydrolase family protein [Deltaproteobacteria bacterium]
MKRRAMKLMKITGITLAAFAGLTLLATSSCVVRQLGGAFTRLPGEAKQQLSVGARKLVLESLEGLDTSKVRDFHVHMLALGSEVEGAYINEAMTSWGSPVRYFKYLIYRSAAGIQDVESADAQFRERLVDLGKHLPMSMKLHILAFDEHYNADGTVNAEKTEFHTPNAYVFAMAKQHPGLFEPVMSVHPYRKDALEALDRWAKEGGHYVKWLPNAMGMDPGDERLDPYYEKMREHGLVLITHAGEEQAVESEEDQALGNPLRLRRALDHGVKVIVSHCASLGTDVDLDDPEGKRVPSFELFLRLMDDPRYEGLVFGDISALTQFNRLGGPLDTILKRQDLHPRLVYGTDYPLPAINALVRTEDLVAGGYITKKERRWLNEIYEFNPILFDFVTKRRLKHPETGERFADGIFEAPAALP